MNIHIKCERCGVEKDLEIKVPKFCGNECRIANLKERMKTVIPPSEEIMNMPPDVPTGATMTTATEIPDTINLQGIENENQTNSEAGVSI